MAGEFALASGAHNIENGSLGVRHALWVYLTPGRLYARVEDTGSYGMTLVVLLALITLIGYCQVQTGLIDRLVDQQTESMLAHIEKEQSNLVDRVQLRETMDAVRKQGEFLKMLRRLGAVVLTPIQTLVSFLLISSLLYAAVALTGRKPEYHTLMSICVYAGFVDLLAIALRFLMMVVYRTVHVDTSLAMIGEPGKLYYLAAIDPFRIWFWVLIAIGVIVTQQLSRRVAIATCILMYLVSSAAHVGSEYARTAL
ncbi:MAG: hypothetical protein DCC65_09390 [Planctomycetota bacterium]|nr:MAG: hypothetical protein DCC65_09390 [Planctomycetota bacterium]